MKKDVSLYLGANIVKMAVSILVMLPLTTYYLSIEEIGVFAFLSLLSSALMIPLSTSANLMINSYYFTSSTKQRRELFYHLYLLEILLKIISFIVVLIVGSVLLESVMKDYNKDYLTVFYVLVLARVFSSTRPILYHFFTVRRESARFFNYNIVEISLLTVLTFFFIYFLEFGLLGYGLSVLSSSFLMFLIDINAVRKYIEFKYRKRWFKIIYVKGIKLFYANLIENLLNFYDSYIVQQTLSMGGLALYSHAKQYVAKFGLLDKAFFQSYSVNYMLTLKGEEKLNIFKITLFWYSFLLIVGICIIYLADDVIGFLTHDKLTKSAEYLAIFYILVFFRSNQQQYSYQILYNKKNEIFVRLATMANIISFAVLTIGVFVFEFGILFIIFSFVLNVILRNIFIKSYAIYKYRNIDISELFFLISLFLYLGVLLKELDFDV